MKTLGLILTTIGFLSCLVATIVAIYLMQPLAILIFTVGTIVYSFCFYTIKKETNGQSNNF